MIYYIIFVIILATILLVLFTELIHDSKEKFKKKIKLILLIFLSTIVLLIMTRFPQVISVVPAIFLILFRWRFLINFLANLVFLKKKRGFSTKQLDKNEALEILGLKKGASKDEIVKKYQDLMKKNHPDKDGSEWITKKLNQARETLLS